MNWFNYYGLIFVAIILIPNVVYAIKHKDDPPGAYQNKAAVLFERIGRYGCMACMVFNIPYTYVGFYFSYAQVVYWAVNGVLVFSYCLLWLIFWKKPGVVRAILLSVLPSLVFLFSAAIIGSIPLFVFSVVFSVAHILISVKNGRAEEGTRSVKKVVWTVVALFLSIVLLTVVSFGGIIAYGQVRLAKLENMSAREMIEYDCARGGTKISVAIVENGETTIRVYGAGTEDDDPYEYEIGSISKTFVGLLCAKAEKEGRLSYSDGIAKYLGFDETKYYPTIERLLTHTSGYKGYYFEPEMIANRLAREGNDYYGISRQKILDKARNLFLEDKDYPFAYSNFGVAVLGLVLEKVYDEDFTDLANTFIREELSLEKTVVAKRSGSLDGYWKWGRNDGYIPAGAIVSDIQDMAAYLSLYMSDGLDYASAITAKRKQIDAQNATYEKVGVRTDAVGLTWMIDERNGIVWHNGATTAFNAYIGFTVDREKGVVMLSNAGPDDGISLTVIGAKILTER